MTLCAKVSNQASDLHGVGHVNQALLQTPSLCGCLSVIWCAALQSPQAQGFMVAQRFDGAGFAVLTCRLRLFVKSDSIEVLGIITGMSTSWPTGSMLQALQLLSRASCSSRMANNALYSMAASSLPRRNARAGVS